MRLPHTDSAEAIWAFKKGYRFAEQGKPLNEMPVTVRAQPWLRDYFMQGYEQAQAELTPPRGDGLTPRKRLIWLVFAALAGTGTAWLMIQQIQADKQTQPSTQVAQKQPAHPAVPPAAAPDAPAPTPEKTARKKVGDPLSAPTSGTALALQRPSQQASPAAPQAAPVPEPTTATAPQMPAAETADTGLLDAEARAKQLAASHRSKPTATSLPPVSDSPIHVVRSILARRVQQREPVAPLGTVIPRNVRKLTFFTEVENGKGHILHHRWYYGNTLMADIRLPIRSNRYRTWSSKRLSPAWQGAWRVEVVDEKGHIIARRNFHYRSGPSDH